MIRHRRQTDFNPGTGDCFRACVAMVLDLDAATLPNFCSVGDGWWKKFQDWLAENHHMLAVEVHLGPGVLAPMVPGVPVIVSGPSYAGDWDHSVVGFTEEGGFELLYDPNPTEKFVRQAKSVLFFAPLRPDLTSRKTTDGNRTA